MLAQHREVEYVLDQLLLLPFCRLTVNVRWLTRKIDLGAAFRNARVVKGVEPQPVEKARFGALKLVSLLLPSLEFLVECVASEPHLGRVERLLLDEPHEELLLHGPLGRLELARKLPDGDVVLVVALLDTRTRLEREIERADDAVVLDGLAERVEVGGVAKLAGLQFSTKKHRCRCRGVRSLTLPRKKDCTLAAPNASARGSCR